VAFTVEDGTGLAAANAYVSEAYVDSHHSDRGNALWTGTTTEKEQAIVRATDYIDKRFGPKFRGFRETRAQALEWPRLSAFDNDYYLYNGDDDVPRSLQKACAEYALISLQIELLPIPARPFAVLDPATGTVTGNASGQATLTRDKLGPLEKERRFSDMTSLITRTKPGASTSYIVSDFNLPEYPVADEWLQELLKTGGARLRRGS